MYFDKQHRDSILLLKLLTYILSSEQQDRGIKCLTYVS